jgi:hypothetical protein
MTAPTTNTPLLDRIHGPAPEQVREPFVAPWRRRQLEQAEAHERDGRSRFAAVHDLTGSGVAL